MIEQRSGKSHGKCSNLLKLLLYTRYFEGWHGTVVFNFGTEVSYRKNCFRRKIGKVHM